MVHIKFTLKELAPSASITWTATLSIKCWLILLSLMRNIFHLDHDYKIFWLFTDILTMCPSRMLGTKYLRSTLIDLWGCFTPCCNALLLGVWYTQGNIQILIHLCEFSRREQLASLVIPFLFIAGGFSTLYYNPSREYRDRPRMWQVRAHIFMP